MPAPVRFRWRAIHPPRPTTCNSFIWGGFLKRNVPLFFLGLATPLRQRGATSSPTRATSSLMLVISSLTPLLTPTRALLHHRLRLQVNLQVNSTPDSLLLVFYFCFALCCRRWWQAIAHSCLFFFTIGNDEQLFIAIFFVLLYYKKQLHSLHVALVKKTTTISCLSSFSLMLQTTINNYNVYFRFPFCVALV